MGADKQQPSNKKKVPGRPWKPGQSGNPKGRPPDPLSLTRAHKDGLGEEVPPLVKETVARMVCGNNVSSNDIFYVEFMKRPLTWVMAFKWRNFYRSLTPDGDPTVRMVWEMCEGKATQRIAGYDGGPLKIEEEKEELRNLSADDLRQLIKLKLKAQNGGNGKRNGAEHE